MLVCPNPSRISDCPSTVWWSDKDSGHKEHEERGIAYVAMTRTREELVVCVSTRTLERLSDRRPAFVAHLDCMTATLIFRI